jgi:alkaline phosphatase D
MESRGDFAVHLGDYIYEREATSVIGRPHLPNDEITSIEDYRIRYALYKSEPYLQAVHAAFPWIVTWDDHETENDYAGFAPENPDAPADNQPDIASRRARAYQAYYEHMPLRAAQLPTGPYLQLYRRLRFGDVLSMHVLDTRQYRSRRAPATSALDQRNRRLLPRRARPDTNHPGRGAAGLAARRPRPLDREVERVGEPGAVRAEQHQRRSADPHAGRREMGWLPV